MKPSTLFVIAAVVAGCSSSSSDRPGSFEERQERIENEREAQAPRDRDRANHEREHAHAPSAPAPVENDFDQDGDRISDADEATHEADPHEADTNKTGAKADNTARNERDSDTDTLTPLDQSSASSDIEITQAIRKKVIGADDLSFNAKNVKIITVSGKVTLRGPVESSEERAVIERSARDVPGVKRVDNQLEVK